MKGFAVTSTTIKPPHERWPLVFKLGELSGSSLYKEAYSKAYELGVPVISVMAIKRNDERTDRLTGFFAGYSDICNALTAKETWIREALEEMNEQEEDEENAEEGSADEKHENENKEENEDDKDNKEREEHEEDEDNDDDGEDDDDDEDEEMERLMYAYDIGKDYWTEVDSENQTSLYVKIEDLYQAAIRDARQPDGWAIPSPDLLKKRAKRNSPMLDLRKNAMKTGASNAKIEAIAVVEGSIQFLARALPGAWEAAALDGDNYDNNDNSIDLSKIPEWAIFEDGEKRLHFVVSRDGSPVYYNTYDEEFKKHQLLNDISSLLYGGLPDAWDSNKLKRNEESGQWTGEVPDFSTNGFKTIIKGMELFECKRLKTKDDAREYVEKRLGV